MNSLRDNPCGLGCPIRKSSDQSLFASSPRLIAGYNVLHRLLPPRHPPDALDRLTIQVRSTSPIGSVAGSPVRVRRNLHGRPLTSTTHNAVKHLGIERADRNSKNGQHMKCNALQCLTTDLIVKEHVSAPSPARKNASLARAFWKRRKGGGARRDRTDDLLLAKQALSQLSYGPAGRIFPSRRGVKSWWVWVDLNHRPHAYQACALTN
jgi:hypothetical protein